MEKICNKLNHTKVEDFNMMFEIDGNDVITSVRKQVSYCLTCDEFKNCKQETKEKILNLLDFNT